MAWAGILNCEATVTLFFTVTDDEDRRMTFMIDEELKVTVSEETLVICRPYDRREIIIDHVKDIKHEIGILVSQKSVTDSQPVVSIQDDCLVISGVDSREAVKRIFHIFDPTGKLAWSGNLDGEMKIPLKRLVSGVNMVKIDGSPAFKFLMP